MKITTLSISLVCMLGCNPDDPYVSVGEDDPTQQLSDLCPDPADDTVHYVSDSDSDPAVCLAIAFSCGANQETFDDQCGCGCIDLPTLGCPDPADPTVHYILDSNLDPSVCLPIMFGCEENQELFSNECGCGCIDIEPPVCPDPVDPSVHYIGGSDTDPSICWDIDFTCGANQEIFEDQCGCGCIDLPTPECPDPTDPAVHYIGDSHLEPHICPPIMFACAENQELFANECGCGCIDVEPPLCPDPEDPTVHYIGGSDIDPSVCWDIDFDCGPNQQGFSDSCGCGCIDQPPSECPDPADPRVHYIEGSYEDPGICLVIFFGCEEGQQLFSDECGCGCIDPV